MSAKFTLKFNLEVFCLSHKPYLIILIFQLTTYTQSAPAACNNQALHNNVGLHISSYFVETWRHVHRCSYWECLKKGVILGILIVGEQIPQFRPKKN